MSRGLIDQALAKMATDPVVNNKYSTTETKVGTWTDGKPLYRKVLTGTSTAGYYYVNISSLNIATPVSVNVVIQNTTGATWVFGPYIQTQGSDSFNFYIYANLSQIVMRSGSSYGFGKYWITIEYTKTTD